MTYNCGKWMNFVVGKDSNQGLGGKKNAVIPSCYETF